MAKFNINLKRSNYELILKAIINGRESPIALQDFIIDFTVYNLYKENVFPVYQIELILRRDIFRLIQDNADNVLFLLSLRRYEESIQDYKLKSRPYDTIFSNEILKPYDISRETTPLLPEEVSDIMIDDEPSVQRNDPNFRLVVNAFQQRHLDMNKEIISVVLNNCTVKDCILYLLNRGGARSVLFSEPDNTKVYEQIMIPGLNMTKSIEYLQQVYGIYNTGLLLFFDYKFSYLLRKDSLKNPVTATGGESNSNSWGKVFIELVEQSRSQPDSHGSYLDEENERVYIKMIDNTTSVASDTSTREIGGEIAKFMSRSKENRNIQRVQDLRMNITNSSNDITNSKKIKEAVFWNRYDNPYIEKEYRSSMFRNQLKLSVPWVDIDLDLITPNRRYDIFFDNNEFKDIYNGAYHLVSTIYKFNKDRQVKNYRVYGFSTFEKLHKDYFK
jgi:hypothetical protein